MNKNKNELSPEQEAENDAAYDSYVQGEIDKHYERKSRLEDWLATQKKSGRVPSFDEKIEFYYGAYDDEVLD